MTWQCLALDLRDDPAAIAEYERWHRAEFIWPEVVRSIRDTGIRDMRIFRTGNRLMMLMRVGAEFDAGAKAAADAASERVQAWEALMSTFQQPLPWAEPGQKWVPMRQIFDLADCG
ncbi:L-rhamnose mutarotase [Luteibacter sp. RCC_6_2]|uniref:L-rhamnose mutarotase n=1 Tax=Luteibacter sp. RCC_6_2 TaxID=3239223 RepID=UPI003524E508